MSFDDQIALSALKYVSGETTHVCRLCFASTETKEIAVDERVRVKTPYYDETVTIINMFHELGVSSEPQLPQVLCISCAKNTVNGYVFRKLCQFSNDNWSHVLSRLSESLSQSDAVSSNVQCIYLMINKQDNVFFTSRKGYATRNKRTALVKIKDILKSRRKYIKVKQTIVDTICEECGERFTSSLNLMKHLKDHTKSQNPCSLCPKIFSTPLQLEEHAERVHQPKRLRCPKCPKMFSTKKILKIHERTFHVMAACKLCHLQFPSRKELRAHLGKHQSNTCTNCNKKFSNKYTFKFHLQTCGNTQDKQPSFFCDICNKGYSRKNGIRTHLKVDHGFGNVMSCNWCGKKFDAISRLKNHIVKHTKEKKFHCEHCGGKFVSQAALIYHIRLHTGERPFPCDLCNESFLSASRRTEHKRRKHYGPTQECHVCHAKFVTGHQLRKHVQRHYNPHSKLYVNDNGTGKIVYASDIVFEEPNQQQAVV